MYLEGWMQKGSITFFIQKYLELFPIQLSINVIL